MSDEPLGNWNPNTDISEVKLLDVHSDRVLGSVRIIRYGQLRWYEKNGIFTNLDRIDVHTVEAGTPGRIELYRNDGRRLAAGTLAENGRDMGFCNIGSKVTCKPGTVRLAGKDVAL